MNLQYETDDVAKEVSSTRTKVHFFKKVKLLAEEKKAALKDLIIKSEKTKEGKVKQVAK